jgi:HSP20 family protein
MFFTPSVFNRHTPAFSLGYARSAYAPSLWASSDALDRLLSDTLDSSASAVRVDSDDKSITLSIDVPGLAKEQLTIGIEGRVLRISSKDDAPRSFKAAYKITSEIDASQSEAKLENGVLTLKLSKLAPQSRETLLTIN